MKAPTQAYLWTHAGLVAGAILLALWPWVVAAEPVSAPRGDRVQAIFAALPGGCGTPLDPTHNFVDGRGPEPRIASVMDGWLEPVATARPAPAEHRAEAPLGNAPLSADLGSRD